MENLTIKELIDIIIKKYPRLSEIFSRPKEVLINRTPLNLMVLASEVADIEKGLLGSLTIEDFIQFWIRCYPDLQDPGVHKRDYVLTLPVLPLLEEYASIMRGYEAFVKEDIKPETSEL